MIGVVSATGERPADLASRTTRGGAARDHGNQIVTAKARALLTEHGLTAQPAKPTCRVEVAGDRARVRLFETRHS